MIFKAQRHKGPHTVPPPTLAPSDTRTPLAEHFPLLGGSYELTPPKLKYIYIYTYKETQHCPTAIRIHDFLWGHDDDEDRP